KGGGQAPAARQELAVAVAPSAVDDGGLVGEDGGGPLDEAERRERGVVRRIALEPALIGAVLRTSRRPFAHRCPPRRPHVRCLSLRRPASSIASAAARFASPSQAERAMLGPCSSTSSRTPSAPGASSA